MQNQKGPAPHLKRLFCCLLICVLAFPAFLTEAAHNGRQYRCLLKNTGGSVYSKAVTLTVKK